MDYSFLKDHFITTDRPYEEGCVEAFCQTIPAHGVTRAVLQITALGVFAAQINGKKAGDALLTPGFTYYPDDLQVQELDVTDLLKGSQAPAVLTVFLGQGWYCGRFTFDNKTQIYGERPAVSWVLTVEDADGTKQHFSDDADVCPGKSPYDYAGLYDGEIFHADGSSQKPYPPVPFKGPIPGCLERETIFVRPREEMPVQQVFLHGDTTILDFGQNFAGIPEIDPQRMEGECLTLRFGERLNADGSLYTANLRKAKQEIVYYKGKTQEKYRPAFTYMGFRYAALSGVPYEEGLVRAFAVYSDMERTGTFTCENPLAERLYENQVWGQKSNYVEVPTDCPQRDERMGYTGDCHVFARTASYNFDTEAFLVKFLKDIRFSQAHNKEGYVPSTVPAAPGEQGIGMLNMLGWGNAVCILPKLLYEQYGNREILRTMYPAMKAFTECEIRHMGGKGLWLGPNLGDWLAPGKDVRYMAMHNGPVSNAFVIGDLRIMAWTADLLGEKEDAARYRAQEDLSTKAYLAAFVKEDGTMQDDYQGAYVMALALVLPEGDLWNKVFAKLVQRLKEEGIQTGFFATQHLLPLLADHKEEALAFDLLFQENCPGWMYEVKRGATTIWERWDALRPDGTVNETKMSSDNMVSFNHYAFGSVGEFYYGTILGIRPAAPGFAQALVAPHIDARLGSFSGSYKSRHGRIEVSFDLKEKRLTVSSEVPGTLRLPDGTTKALTKAPASYRIAL